MYSIILYHVFLSLVPLIVWLMWGGETITPIAWIIWGVNVAIQSVFAVIRINNLNERDV